MHQNQNNGIVIKKYLVNEEMLHVWRNKISKLPVAKNLEII